jgi:UDP-glucose 4-epimerase
VTALDVLSTGRLADLESASTHPRFRFVQGSVLDELVVDELVQDYDVVVHMAAAVDGAVGSCAGRQLARS